MNYPITDKKGLPYGGLDTETTYSTEYSVSTLGNQGYVNDPRFDCYLISIDFPDWNWVGHPRDCPWEKLRGRSFVSANAGFDQAVLRRMIELGQAPAWVYPEDWVCSANLSVYCGYPRALGQCVEQLFGRVVDKKIRNVDMKGHNLDSMSPELREKVMLYAAADARECRLVWEELAGGWPMHERRISELTYAMGARGMHTDRAGVDADIATLRAANAAAFKKIPWTQTTPASVPLSPKALKAYCAGQGIEPPSSLAQTSEECAAWEEKYGEQFPIVGAMRDYRRTNALLKKYEVIAMRLNAEDRMPYSLKYFGASTGRWSGESGFNCVTGDHEVLTPEGWVRIDAWDTTTPIMQWADGTLSFVTGGKISKDWDGDMVKVVSRDVSLLCTPDHRVLTYDYKRRQKVRPARDFLGAPLLIETAGQVDTKDSPLSDGEIQFLVALAADGTKIIKRGKMNGAITFGFKKDRKIKRLGGILSGLQIPFIQKKGPSGITHFYIDSKNGSRWQKGFGPWILSLSKRQLKILLDELVHWDGHANSVTGNTTFFTTVKAEAAWVKTAAHLCGIRGGHYTFQNPKVKTGEAHHVYLKQATVKTVSRNKGDVSCTQEKFKGKVYCPSVPSSFWLVRHNGCIHVTGNCQNLPKEPMYFAPDWSITRTKTDQFVEMRSKFTAAPGKKLIIADYAQIEARVLPWLAKDKETIDLVRSGLSVYDVHALQSGMWDGKGGSLKKVNKTLYALAKARVLGLGFGCGWLKFVTFAKQALKFEVGVFDQVFGAPVSEEARAAFVDYVTKYDKKGQTLPAFHKMAEREQNEWVNSWLQVTDFRDKNPKIVALWKHLDNGLKSSVGGTYEIGLPSGRVLQYFNVTSRGGEMMVRTTKGGHFSHAYGGLLTENLVQATARDVLAKALIRLADAGIHVIATIHDEVVCEVDPSVTMDTVISLMTQPPAWAKTLPLGAEAEESMFYKK